MMDSAVNIKWVDMTTAMSAACFPCKKKLFQTFITKKKERWNLTIAPLSQVHSSTGPVNGLTASALQFGWFLYFSGEPRFDDAFFI